VIALDATRARMLEEIQASAELLAGKPAAPEDAALDPGAETRLLLRKNAPEAILPALNSFLARYFSELSEERLQRDLLSPLKKAVGNAHKRGNQRDPGKLISVEVVLTRAGAFLEVSDEGAGFDVEGKLALFRAGGSYFQHHGSGFRRFTKARSVIAFDRGGRTFRLRFLRVDDAGKKRQATRGQRA
jgi:hypothetical protein